MVKSLLDRVTKDDIIAEPYPHIVIKNVLPEEDAAYLLEHFPTLEQLSDGTAATHGLSVDAYPEHKKFCKYGQEVAKYESLDPKIKEFFSYHASVSFLKEVCELFEEHIMKEAPHVMEYVKNIKDSEIGFIDNSKEENEGKKLIIDGGVCIDTPAKTKGLPAIIHLDNEKKILGALYYLKHADDESEGGELNIYSTPDTKFVTDSRMKIKEQYIPDFERSVAKAVPYEHNTLIIFLNSARAFHGVGPRYNAKHFRYTFNFAFNANTELFNFEKYKESKLTRRMKYIRNVVKKKLGIGK